MAEVRGATSLALEAAAYAEVGRSWTPSSTRWWPERTREIAETGDLLESQNTQLEEARIAADRANKTKSEFLANMSHELRTPMTEIFGLLRVPAENKRLALESRVADDVPERIVSDPPVLTATARL